MILSNRSRYYSYQYFQQIIENVKQKVFYLNKYTPMIIGRISLRKYKYNVWTGPTFWSWLPGSPFNQSHLLNLILTGLQGNIIFSNTNLL